VVRIGTHRPYPPTGLTTQAWKRIPPSRIAWDELTTTQDGCTLQGLLGPTREGSDLFPHVVAFGGVMYLEDGHCRMVKHLLAGRSSGLVRILR
jgi:hypothetical protein